MGSDESTGVLSQLDSLFNIMNQNTKIVKALINLILYKELIMFVKSICKVSDITPYLAKRFLKTLISENLIIQIDESKKEKKYILTGIMKIILELKVV